MAFVCDPLANYMFGIAEEILSHTVVRQSYIVLPIGDIL